MKQNNPSSCIIVDTCCNQTQFASPHIYLLPLYIIENFSDHTHKTYKELFEISQKEVINKLQQKINLSTSQAALGEMIHLLDALVLKYKRIFILPISSKLSSTYNTWKIAIDQFCNKCEIVLLDGLNLGYAYALLINDLTKMIENNEKTETIVAYVNQKAAKRYAVLVLKDLTQLKNGGRISAFKAELSSLLKLNILISFDGGLAFCGKTNSNQKAIEMALKKIDEMINYTKNGIEYAYFAHSFVNNAQLAKIKVLINQTFNHQLIDTDFPATILTHIGINAYTIYIASK